MATATAPRTAPTEAEIREAIEDRAGRYGEIEHPKELLRQAIDKALDAIARPVPWGGSGTLR